MSTLFVQLFFARKILIEVEVWTRHMQGLRASKRIPSRTSEGHDGYDKSHCRIFNNDSTSPIVD
jgi:hypothetical protein